MPEGTSINKVSAKSNKADPPRTVEVEYDFGDTIQEMVDRFGDKVTASNARRNMIVTLQANIRRWAEAGKADDEIQELANQWKPGEVTRTGKSKLEKAAALTDGMTDEELKQLAQAIKARRQAQAA